MSGRARPHRMARWGALVALWPGLVVAAPGGAAAAPAASTAPKSTAPKSTAPKSTAATGTPYPLECPITISVPSSGVRAGPSPLPPPSSEQLRALQLLEAEAAQYEAGAKAFRGTLTKIVRHHYEERRRRILAALEEDLKLERSSLAAARRDAIRRLERFIVRYSGDNADPKETPDAMFRLAALYEERARGDYDSDLNEGLKSAIALYRRVLTEYPEYSETAAVHYYLGHALTDSGRLEEGQQAWRALVCRNHYAVEPVAGDSSKIQVQPLPQDHDRAFWTEWYNKNPLPLDQTGRGKRDTLGVAEEELSFIDPYADCKPIPQETKPGQQPRYLGEIWWQLGNWHFEEIDAQGGPYNLNRAASAYEHSLQYEQPPLYGVALYKQAWTYFKQQRYRDATLGFVDLLHYTDQQEARTGDPGADFRAEAYTYIAGALTYVDFHGPPPEDPFIPRTDVLLEETDPGVAEEKMAIAIQRVQDQALIPQDKSWTVEIYKALSREFMDINHYRNAIATMQLTLDKFPLDRDAPLVQSKVAELYELLARNAPRGSAARTEYADKALEARSALVRYVGATQWTNANRNDPEALAQAEGLVRGGLKKAAADHTNFARAFAQKASELSDKTEQLRLIQRAIEAYELAEISWGAYLAQDQNAADAYESRFWLADARYHIVALNLELNTRPPSNLIEKARESLAEVRDSNEDDKYLQPAAFYTVAMSEDLLDYEHERYEATNGASGIERRETVQFADSGGAPKPVAEVLPKPVQHAVCSRDEYNARIPLDKDPERNGLLYAFQAADYFFVYGQFAEARRRLEPIYEQRCGKDEWGYKAWEKLISMSNFEGDAARSRALAEGRSCAYDEDSRQAEAAIREPVKQGVAYLDARSLYEQAEQMPEGPDRDKRWREAAAAYKVALDAAPDRDEAPEAAMNGAYAYKQVGEYDKAIAMYRLFISRYGDEKTLDRLQQGDAKAKPPVEPDPARYEERVGFLKSAYDALASSYVLFFDYPKAAETFEAISSMGHFKREERREATRQALSLYSSLDDASGMRRGRDRYARLGAGPKELAEADFIVASATLKRWDALGSQRGANAAARARAMSAMDAYFARNKTDAAATQYVVHAAYWSARTRAAANPREAERWWERTIDAFERYKRSAPAKDGQSSTLGGREAAMAAEAEYTLIDEELQRKFDYESGHHRYEGTPVEVVRAYNKDATEAKRWFDKLQKVVDRYRSPEWSTVAIARQGSVYDSLRTGLYNTRPPALEMFTAQQERALRRAEESDNLDLQEKADAIRVKVRQAWRDKRDQELDSADKIVVDRYATAVMLARRFNVSKPGVTRAIRRLAFLTEVVGEAKMQAYTGRIKDLKYTDGMFQRMRPGVVTAPEPSGLPAPAPPALGGP